MPIVRLIAILAVAAGMVALELPNPRFEDAAPDGGPAGWQPQAWDRPAGRLPVVPGAAAGSRAIRIEAVEAGGAGWASARMAFRGGSWRVGLVVRADGVFTGSAPWFFIACFGGGSYLGAVPVAVGALPSGSWGRREAVVDLDGAPARTDEVSLCLACRSTGGPAAGGFEIDAVDVAEEPGMAIPLVSDRPANWLAPGERAVIGLGGRSLPGWCATVALRIADSAGRQTGVAEVTAADFAAGGWTWQPSDPGLFRVTAEAVDAGGARRRPLVARRTWSLPDGSAVDTTWDGIQFAVAAPARPMSGRCPVFGYTHSTDRPADRQAALADLVGFRFAKLAAVGWGAMNARTELAIEPERGVFRWERLDATIADIAARGLDIAGTVQQTPRWASPHPDETGVDICIPRFSAYAPADLADWTRFLTRLAERYRGRVFAWELWNEPHLPGSSVFWRDTPERFAAMLAAGRAAIRAADPAVQVWIGGMGMRYLPFYRQLARAGGAAHHDALALHGLWVDPRPFCAIDAAAGIPERPWVISEHHSVLVQTDRDVDGIDEAALAGNLVRSWLWALRAGCRRLAMFELTDLVEPEVLPAAKRSGWFVHASGLFRASPRIEPRLAALVAHTFLARLGPGTAYLSEHRVGDAAAIALGDGDRRTLLVAWRDGAGPAGPPPPEFAAVAAGAEVCDWEGRACPGWPALAPGVMYLVDGVERRRLAGLPAGVAIAASRVASPAPNATAPVPHAAASWGLDGPPRWITDGMVHVGGAGPGDVSARFAVAADGSDLEVVVEVADPDHHPVAEPGRYWQGDSVQVAIDTAGYGVDGDQVQFTVADLPGGAVVWKDRTPDIGGDLPQRWTMSGRPAAYATARVEAIPGGRRYRIRLAVTELFPWRPERSRPLRLGLLVNSSRGQGRAGWVEWSSGIGAGPDPSRFGVLDWAP